MPETIPDRILQIRGIAERGKNVLDLQCRVHTKRNEIEKERVSECRPVNFRGKKKRMQNSRERAHVRERLSWRT